MRVLIVDNQPRARQNLRALLGAWHQIGELRAAAYVCEALHGLEKLQPETFLMDARVPDNCGLKAIQLIKPEYRSFTIIVFSMNPVLKAKAIAAGADAFISKSDYPEKLRETLLDLLDDRIRSDEKQIQSLAFFNQ